MNIQQIDQQKLQEQIKMQQQIASMEAYAKQYLTNEAITRYGNIKTAHSEKALQIIALLVQLAQQGQIKEKLTDEQFKNLLLHLTPEKTQTRIKII